MTEKFFEKFFCKKKKNQDQNQDDEVYEPHQQQSEEEKNQQKVDQASASEQIEKQDFQEAPSAQQKIEIENEKTKQNQIIEVKTQPKNPPIKLPSEQIQINQKIKVIAINKLPDDQVNINIQNQNNFIQNQFNPQQQYQENQTIFQNQQQMQQFQNQQQQYVNCQNGALNNMQNRNYQNSHNEQRVQNNFIYQDHQGSRNQNFQFNGGYRNQQNQIIQCANQQNQKQYANQQNQSNYQDNQQNQLYPYDNQQNTCNQQPLNQFNRYNNQQNQINKNNNGQQQFKVQNNTQQYYYGNDMYQDNYQYREDLNTSRSAIQHKQPCPNQIYQSQQSNSKYNDQFKNQINNVSKNEYPVQLNFNSSGQKSNQNDEESETQTQQIKCQYCNNEIQSLYVQLTCLHYYCQECLKDSLKIQISQPKTTFFHCQCGMKIKPKQIWERKSDLRIDGKIKKDNFIEQLKNSLWKNQVEKIEDQLKGLENYTKCKKCDFFVLNNNNYPQEFYCLGCQKNTK